MANRQYIGARYVPKFSDKNNGIWNNGYSYEPLEIVKHGADFYTAKIPVPTGVDILNTTYWVKTGDYNGAISGLQTQINDMKDANVTGSLQNQISHISTLMSNKKVLCISDSYGVPVTEGYSTYPSWIDLLLTQVDGYKIAEGGAGFVSYFNVTFLAKLQSEIGNITNKNDYTDIIIAGGCNDASDSSISTITGAQISTAIQNFITYAKSQFPNAKIKIACIGAFSTAANLTERALNLENVVRYAYANTDADYEYCTFSESVLADHSLIYGVHPTENGQIELYKYFMRALNGSYNFYKSISNVITLNDSTVKYIPGVINNNILQTLTIKTQFDCGVIDIGPTFNFGAGVKIGTIRSDSALAIPSKSGYCRWTIMCSAYMARQANTGFSALDYAGVAYLFPSEDGKDLMVQITSPDGVGTVSNKMNIHLYVVPLSTAITL